MEALKGIGSMATRQVLQEIAGLWNSRREPKVSLESAGGVEVGKRVREGEAFDLVFLASDALGQVAAEGKVDGDASFDLFRSEVVAAVRKGAQKPDISSVLAFKNALKAAKSIGYSTGPSGKALVALFEGWGIYGEIKDKMIVAPTGVPVGSLIAAGDVEFGFQQRSELIHVEGIEILGSLPGEAAIVTIFSGAVASGSKRKADAKAFLEFIVSPEARAATLAEGLSPFSK
ncbi:MAG: molybdate transport system substrate-binding protein [Spirochaetes bacterium]|nr:MAG: molybdate transport system substrate-binding protein [Spirochaetota bacterium]